MSEKQSRTRNKYPLTLLDCVRPLIHEVRSINAAIRLRPSIVGGSSMARAA